MLLRELNKINNNKSPQILKNTSNTISKPLSIMNRIKNAKTKKEKREIIEEWILCEIKKINKDSEMDDF